MMRLSLHRLTILLAAMLAAGCAAHVPGHISLGELASSNQGRLSQVALGMTKEQVIAVMGTAAADTHDGVVNNPWTVEGFTNHDGSRYEVLFYVTRPNQPFTPVRKSLTTPIVLRNGQVVGWGTEALDHVDR